MASLFNINPHIKYSKFLCCAVASEISLFKGINGIDNDEVEKAWTYSDYPPSARKLKKLVGVSNIKWYIRNYIQVEDKVWNGHFLRGISTVGNIKWRHLRFPTLVWYSNCEIFNIIKECPFHGRIDWNSTNDRKYWYDVPAFYLPVDEKHISFMAGVLATGELFQKNGESYISYKKSVLPYLKSWGIPIEYQSPSKVRNMISPFWTALFSCFMPNCSKKWCKVENAVNANLYAAILWRMYISGDIKREGIPFLKSRRWVYNKIGKMEDTENQWLKLGLSQLDSRIKYAVRHWEKNV